MLRVNFSPDMVGIGILCSLFGHDKSLREQLRAELLMMSKDKNKMYTNKARGETCNLF